MSGKKFHLTLLLIFGAVFIWSAISPKDYFTWFLEVFPSIIGVIILLVIYKKFKFTDLVYFLIFLDAIILLVGGHYTYAQVPLFNYFKEVFDLSRNHFDRLGHFMQGLMPAIMVREIFLRKKVLKSGAWLSLIVVCVCLSISAFYELFEWWVAITTGVAADSFLGTQGDVWDTQWDMFMALAGAILGLLLFTKIQNKTLQKFFELN